MFSFSSFCAWECSHPQQRLQHTYLCSNRLCKVSMAWTSLPATSFPLSHWPQPICEACFSSSLNHCWSNITYSECRDQKMYTKSCVCARAPALSALISFVATFWTTAVWSCFFLCIIFLPSPTVSASLYLVHFSLERVMLQLLQTRHFSILPLRNKRLKIRRKKDHHCMYVIKVTCSTCWTGTKRCE